MRVLVQYVPHPINNIPPFSCHYKLRAVLYSAVHTCTGIQPKNRVGGDEMENPRNARSLFLRDCRPFFPSSECGRIEREKEKECVCGGEREIERERE